MADPAERPHEHPAAEVPPLLGLTGGGWISGACSARAGRALCRRPYDGRPDEGGGDDADAI